ncbi:MAG: thiopurine S-methyltransferase [Gammaproteobacteria bacterium]
MDPQFWHGRWERDQIGFHQQEVNVHLQNFWGRLGTPGNAPVFVPLCGKSQDMCWLAEQGHPVVGVELSPIAVEAFFTENGLTATRTDQGAFTRWHSGSITILCGDFFALRREDLADVAGVYDRASLIALPPQMRQRYAHYMAELLAPQTPCLLVTFEYPQQQMDGPPFSVAAAEVEALYRDSFALERLYHRNILDENPRFKEAGLTSLEERVFRLTRLG